MPAVIGLERREAEGDVFVPARLLGAVLKPWVKVSPRLFLDAFKDNLFCMGETSLELYSRWSTFETCFSLFLIWSASFKFSMDTVQVVAFYEKR
jgi:hypothetical protein